MTQTHSLYPALPLDLVQHCVLEDVSWEQYQDLLEKLGGRPIRVTYDDGMMEIRMCLALEHEQPKKLVGRMVEMLAFLMDKPIASLGSTTFQRKDRKKGLEPDERYYFRDEAKMRGKKRLNLRKDPPPELVIEIDVTHRSIPREPICAALGVPELWRYDGQVQCLHLKSGEYVVRKMSLAFAFLEPARLSQFIDMVPPAGETAAMKAFVAWVRKSGWAKESP
jgi:Uma2 family endonuclease